MLHKFYVVVDHPDYKQELLEELQSDSGNESIPNRSVEITNPMPGSEFNSTVLLTEQEADALISDLRIKDVHRDPYELGIRKVHHGIRANQSVGGTPSRYDKSSSMANHYLNWGLIRSTATTDIFGTLTSVVSSFPYNLDGTGVDVVIIDTGVEANHVEFTVNPDGTGGSRVVDHDWTQYGYITSAPVGGFLKDCDGHGSHVASIVAGNTYGWAPGARIYSLRTIGDGTAGPYYDIYPYGYWGAGSQNTQELGLVDDFEAWQSIRAFHNAKDIDPTTGHKRPTIVNCSFGFIKFYDRVTAINYRGTTYSVSTTTGIYGTIGVPEGGIGLHGYRYAALEAEIASCIDAGVIVVAAAGNDRHKIDTPGGVDYNNYWTDYEGYSWYYHRGSTPAGTSGVITVGCIAAATTVSANPEHKRNFSCAGPRVDIWAPGDYIVGAYGYYYGSGAYNLISPYEIFYPAIDPGFDDVYNSFWYIQKLSGTSQACPQVVGVLSCFLSARPWITPQQARSWTTATASTWLVDENYYGGSGYTNFGSLQGGAAKALWQPFILPDPLVIRG